MQLEVWGSAAGPGLRAEPGRPNNIWCIFGLKELDLARPSRAVVKCLQKLPTDWAPFHGTTGTMDNPALASLYQIFGLPQRAVVAFPVNICLLCGVMNGTTRRGGSRRRWADDVTKLCNSDLHTLTEQDRDKWVLVVQYAVDTHGH